MTITRATIATSLAIASTAGAGTYDKTPTKYVEASGIKLAYRTLGADGGTPLVLLQHFTGTMDDWDPALIDGLAKTHKLYILDNAGLGASGGTTPDSVPAMAKVAASFIDALHLNKVDLLGFSLGGLVSQQIMLDRPKLVRKAILVGTGPQGDASFKELPGVVQDAFKRSAAEKVHPKVFLFFTDTAVGKQAAAEFVARINKHTVDPEPVATDAAIQAQLKAWVTWGATPAVKLDGITQPVLVVNGSRDAIAATSMSVELYQRLPHAQLVLYPDSGHGSLFQYHDTFVVEVDAFLRN
jgi:pimeloyl-ACP methyl ester carboxylesterase